MRILESNIVGVLSLCLTHALHVCTHTNTPGKSVPAIHIHLTVTALFQIFILMNMMKMNLSLMNQMKMKNHNCLPIKCSYQGESSISVLHNPKIHFSL